MPNIASKMAQHRPNLGQHGPNIGQRRLNIRSTWFNIGPRCAQHRPHGPNLAQPRAQYPPNSLTCARPSPTQTLVGRRPAVRRKPLKSGRRPRSLPGGPSVVTEGYIRARPLPPTLVTKTGGPPRHFLPTSGSLMPLQFTVYRVREV